MQRLLWMFGLQLVVTPSLVFLAAALADASERWDAVGLYFKLAIAAGLIGGAALGWILGRPTPNAAPRPGYPIAGAVLGGFVFGWVGFAFGLLVGHILGVLWPVLALTLAGLVPGARLGHELAR